MGGVFQTLTLDLDLSVCQNLLYHAVLHGMGKVHAVERLGIELTRLEVAHVQYYVCGLNKRAVLLPTREQLNKATVIVEAAQKAEGRTGVRLRGYRLLRQVADMYGRMGPAVFQQYAVGGGDAVPCRRDHLRA